MVNKLAGNQGNVSAQVTPEQALRRIVMANLLGDTFYDNMITVRKEIKRLIQEIEPQTVALIAIEAKEQQKLRRVPLHIAVEMAKLPSHRKILGDLLPKIINRPDDIGAFLEEYWREGKKPIAKQVKKGLAKAFENFNEFQFSKYKGRKSNITLQDAIRLTHPKPDSQERNSLYYKIRNDYLPIPNTWETRLSSGENKKDVFEDLLKNNGLGGLAFLRNLRNMRNAGVDKKLIQEYFSKVNTKWLLPLNYLAAIDNAPEWRNEIEALMLNGYGFMPKLKGKTVFGVDVSGSMNQKISRDSNYSRLDVAIAMAVMAREVCEEVIIFATSGYDGSRKHKGEMIDSNLHGFALGERIRKTSSSLGCGGIFTNQFLEYAKQEVGTADRIIIFSDSQDTSYDGKLPSPFGSTNYIVDVSCEIYGINYQNVWTAEVSGWSERFLHFIANLEGLQWSVEE